MSDKVDIIPGSKREGKTKLLIDWLKAVNGRYKGSQPLMLVPSHNIELELNRKVDFEVLSIVNSNSIDKLRGVRGYTHVGIDDWFNFENPLVLVDEVWQMAPSKIRCTINTKYFDVKSIDKVRAEEVI